MGLYGSAHPKLKKLLEGKKVLKVDPPDTDEAICKITMSDGVTFRLSATELGSWVEETGATSRNRRRT